MRAQPSRFGWRNLFVFLVCVFVGSPARGGDSTAIAVGDKVPGFSLRDTGGDARSLADLAGQRATVGVFLSIECPMSNAYIEPLVKFSEQYREKGVNLLLINSNDQETEPQIAAHAKEFHITCPVLKDADQSVADLLGARVTPEAFVIDADRVLRYRGRIDDTYVTRAKRRDQPTRDDLRQALDEVLAGKPVTRPETEATGCPIARVVAPKKAANTVTFNRDVMNILQERCQVCHRPGEAAPFSLMSYRQAVKWASDIERVTEDRTMPPWKPVAGFGEFRDERRLTDAEVATIAAWVEAGTPEGDPADLPPPREFASGGWQLGEPDLELSMTEEYELYASGRDVIRQFVVPTGVTEDKWVTAVEFRPGNQRIAHHAIFFLDTSGRARQLDEADPAPGFGRGGFFPSGGIGGWAVGTQPAPLPEGVGMRLPKNSDLVLQMHYHPSGKPEKDRSKLGVYFAKEPVKKQLAGVPVFGWRFSWPAGDDRLKTTGQFVLPVDSHAISVFPHMHLLGKEFKMTATLPDGTVQPLIYVKDWDFNWQQAYYFKEPLALPKGTRIELESYADNSDKNPFNPNSPPKSVTFGEQTTNEMCIGFVGGTVDDDSQFRDLLPFGRLRQRAQAAKKE